MALDFSKAFNKYADVTNKVAKGVNQVVGKEVLGEMKKIEAPKEFAPYESFAPYPKAEPQQWTPLSGNPKELSLEGNTIYVSSNLDTCVQYRKLYKETARYYADRFEFKFKECVTDYDTFVNYFIPMYTEGLRPMLDRTYGVLLSFGVINLNSEELMNRHMQTFKRAIDSYGVIAGVEATRKQMAQNLGDTVGNTIHMQGGGFGVKGAIKGVAQAEAMNLGMKALGKLAEIQAQMTQEEKAEVFSKLNQSLFFEEVYSDYCNTFLTMVATLVGNQQLENVASISRSDFDVMIQNMENPMFPQDKIVPTIVNLISSNPFDVKCMDLLKTKIGETEEVKNILNYFAG